MEQQREFCHRPVLLEECIRQLDIKPEGIYVDGTLGGGGHAFQICRRLTTGRLIGIDRDQDAIEAAGRRLSEFGEKAAVIRGNYRDMKKILSDLNITSVDGILLDLGVSSYQLDTPERGFGYRQDAPLDMRMDQRQALTAKELVNTYSQSELFHIIRDYGEDRFAKNIAKHIVLAREEKPIETTGELVSVIRRAIPMKIQAAGGHPAKRTFQAIRIALNDELGGLSDSMEEMISLLAPKGRLCIITFHSLEDRIVKNAFKKAEDPCTCPKDFPVCVCGKISQGKVLTRKPILPSGEELDQNSRAKSAKLRVFEKR